MTPADYFVSWLAINASCLWILIRWCSKTKDGKENPFPWHVVPGHIWTIVVALACAIGLPVLGIVYVAYLEILYHWDSWLLWLIGRLIRAIPRDTKSQTKRRIMVWASKRLSSYVNRWLSLKEK